MSKLPSSWISVFSFLPALVLSILLFGKLFSFYPKIFYTPDYGLSDIWHFNYPVKFFMAESIKKLELPLWNSQIGQGFPLYAEGQMGLWYIPNLILFFFLPTWLAWNLQYPISFALMFAGTYIFLKSNRYSSLGAAISSTGFSFGTYLIAQIPHLNLIQAAALFPWILYFSQSLTNSFSRKKFILLSLILSQQIFAGYLQITFITLIGILFFFFFNNFFTKTLTAQKLNVFFLFSSILLAILITSVQLLPSLELYSVSEKAAGLSLDELFRFQYPIGYLQTLINPFILGTPSQGTAQIFGPEWGIYWENVTYIGLIPLGLAVYALVNSRKHPWVKTWALIGLFSFLVMLGKQSPINLIFQIPGFNSFRVPSRFILLFTFSLVCLSAHGLETLISNLKQQKWTQLKRSRLLFVLVILTTFDLFYYAHNYNPAIPVSEALKPPEIINFLEPDQRVFTDDQFTTNWLQHMNENGWTNLKPFLYYKNILSPNNNLLYNLSQVKEYSGMKPQRTLYFSGQSNLKLLKAASTNYYLVSVPLSEPNFELLTTIYPPTKDLLPIYLYQDTAPLPRFRYADNYIISTTPQQLATYLDDPSFNFSQTTVLETPIDYNTTSSIDYSLQVRLDTPTHIKLESINSTDQLLIIANSFYPGWQATINQQPAPLIPANINQQSLLLPPGNNQIELTYSPKSFTYGLLISFSTLLFSLAIWPFSLPKKLANLRQKK